jgi:hypothetical protein
MFRRNRKTREFRLTCFSASDAANQALTSEDIRDAILRHQRGDWGSVDRQTRRENDNALQLGDGPLLSIFETRDGIRFSVDSNRFHTFANIELLGRSS